MSIVGGGGGVLERVVNLVVFTKECSIFHDLQAFEKQGKAFQPFVISQIFGGKINILHPALKGKSMV